MKIVIDAHSDLPSDILGRRAAGQTGILKSVWLPAMEAGGIDVRVAAIFSSPQYIPELALRRALDEVAAFLDELDAAPGACLCGTHEDILRAKAEGKRGFILGMEGVEPLGADLHLLRIFHRLGVRVLGITHALRNYAADGAFFEPKRTGVQGGLSDFGVELVERAQATGMLLDVSHLNDTGFWDVIKFSRAPVIASHSNCRALADHPRNLTDDQIKAVADSGGVIGINSIARFVDPPDLPHLLDHVDRLVKVAGREHVGLGLDFCHYLLEHKSPVERSGMRKGAYLSVEGLDGDHAVPKIPALLAERGHPADTIDLIMGENFLRVFKAVFPS
ncbi:MAG TPA: dipeptidase [Candidatus Methylomirabilis sp.]|nr:dipeptidase [Candidatus Methylomirabilis sp.]